MPGLFTLPFCAGPQQISITVIGGNSANGNSGLVAPNLHSHTDAKYINMRSQIREINHVQCFSYKNEYFYALSNILNGMWFQIFS